MEEKGVILKEISALIESDNKELGIELNIMDFMSLEELRSIRDSLLRRKANRAAEQESWYNEWVNKCGK